MRKATLRMLSLLTAFIMTFSSVNMAAFASELEAGGAVISTETTEEVTVSVEEGATESGEIGSTEEVVSEENASSETEDETATESVEETTTEEETTTAEINLEELEELDAVTLVQDTYYKNENGNYDIFIAVCVPEVPKTGYYYAEMYVDGKQYRYDYQDENCIFGYSSGYSGNTNHSVARLSLNNIPLTAGEHDFKAVIEGYNYDQATQTASCIKSGYIEGKLNLSSEVIDDTSNKATNQVTVSSKDSARAGINATFKLSKDDDILKTTKPVLVSKTDSTKRFSLASCNISYTYKSEYFDIKNSKYKYDLVVDGETITFHENVPGISVYADIVIPYEQLSEGIFNLEFTTKNGSTRTLVDAVEVLKDKLVIESVSSAHQGIYVCDSMSDYIAFVVYGRNIPDDLIPKFYMSEDMSEGNLAGVLDMSDPRCAMSPDLGDGRIYKIRKSDALRTTTSGTIYFKYSENEAYKDTLFYRGYSTIRDGEGNAIGLKGSYMFSPISHVYFENKAAKKLRVYFSNNAFGPENVVGDLIEVGNTVYANGKQVTKSYIGTISKDNNGEYYVEVPSSEIAFSAIALSGYGFVKYGEAGDPSSWDMSFMVTKDTTVTVLSNLAVAAGKWTLRYPDMTIFRSGDAGKDLLSSKDVLALSRMSNMILEVTDNGITKVTQVCFKSVATEVDTIICMNGNDNSSVQVAKGEGWALLAPESVPSEYTNDEVWKNNHTFEGWYLKSDITHTNKMDVVMAEGGKTVELVAYWKPKTYTVVITSGKTDGQYDEVCSLELPYNGKLTLNCETTGIEEFAGKEVRFGTPDKFYSGVVDLDKCNEIKCDEDGNTIYIGYYYNLIQYHVNYHTNGVSVSGLSSNTITVETSEDIILPDLNDSKYGLKLGFLGWYTDSSLDDEYKIEKVEAHHIGDVDVYAKWEKKDFTLKFDSNLAKYPGTTLKTTAIPDITNKGYGEVFALPTSTYTIVPADANDKTKWSFVGWSTTQTDDVSLVEMNPKEMVSFEEDADGLADDVITLYAVYQKETEIIYDADGGVLPEEIKHSHVIGDGAYTLPAPTKAGYDFQGWYLYDSKTGVIGKKLTSVTDKNIGTVVLKAVWKERTYKVTLNPNGGKGKTLTLNVKYTDNLDLSAYSDYTRVGYSFAGFTFEDADIATFSPTVLETVKNSKNGTKFTLKAKWNLINYTITYDTKGGAALESQVYQYSTIDTILQNPVREGYTFAGWFTDEAYKKNAGSYKNGEAKLKKGTVGDITLYAKWTRNYKLVLHVDDASGVPPKIIDNYKFETAKAIPSVNYKKQNEAIAGWSRSQDGPKVYDAKAKISGDNNIDASGELHLFAIWKNSKYTINFYFGNSEESGYYYGYSQTADTGKLVTLKKDPVPNQTGILLGWTRTAGSNNVEYANGAKVDLSAYVNSMNQVALYPIRRSIFEITFDKNADDANISRTSYVYTYGQQIMDKSFAIISVPSRPGYVFSGWYTDAACKKAFKRISATQSGDITLYAKWVPAAYNVTYVANAPENMQATGNMRNQKLAYLKSTALTKNSYKVKGYNFTGWALSANGLVTYANGEKVTQVGANYSENPKLYACWSPIEYSITYNVERRFLGLPCDELISVVCVA